MTILSRTLICGCLLWHPHASFGGHLAEELALDRLSQVHWQRRSLELIHIEEYMVRNIRFNPKHLDLLHDLLGHHNHLTGINHFINTPNEENETELTTKEIQASTAQKELIEHTLQSLPKLEVQSFKGQLMQPHIWEQLNYGDIYHEKGFFNTVGSLHTAYKDLNTYKQQSGLYRLIMTVQGQNGRLAHTIYDHGESEIMWPSQSYFKVIAKDHDPVTHTYYMRLSEIEPSQIKPTDRIISSYDGSQIHTNRLSCRAP